MRGIFNTHGQNMSVAQGLRRHATTAGREPTCATRNMPTRNVSRTARAVLPNRTARLAVQNGPYGKPKRPVLHSHDQGKANRLWLNRLRKVPRHD